MTIGGEPGALAAKLSAWIGTRLEGEPGAPARAVQVTLLGPPPSGNSNVTLPFVADWDAGSIDLVLRMQHPENQIFLDADVMREFEILAALETDQTIPSPQAVWSEPDPDVLGHPFFVMERVHGDVPAGMPSIHVTGWLAEQDPATRTASWNSALAALGAIHSFDWRTHLPHLADGANGVDVGQRLAHLDRWYRWVTAGRPFPVTDAGLDHLHATVGGLAPAEPVLLWGDARLGNTMFRSDGRVAAVLDWELASIGPAGVDLGWWLAFEEFNTAAHGIEPMAGLPGRDATIERYEALSGESIADIEWYETLAEWVITVTVIRMADVGVAAGRLRPDTRMGHGNLTAQMLARRLGLEVPALDRDYAIRRGLAPPTSATS